MSRDQIDSQAVFRIVAVALLTIAGAALLGLIVVKVDTTIRWLVTAIFLALALAPGVELIGRVRVRGWQPPRWLAILLTFVLAFLALFFLVLNVIPPMVDEVEQVGSLGPQYVHDAQQWANDSEQFRELNRQYDLISTLKSQAAELPSHFSDAAGELESFTVSLLKHLVSAVSVIVLAFFLLLEGPRILDRVLAWVGGSHERRGRAIAAGIYRVVRGYVTVNLMLAVVAGLFTWGMLEALGVELAVPLAILVAILDLVPLIGLTIGGVVVTLVAALHSFPDAMIVWIAAFVLFQQLQDRVVQPLLYGRAVKVNPLIAIVVLFMGAQIAGILGALIAIPVAASIAVVFNVIRADRNGGPAEPIESVGPEPAVEGGTQPA